MSSAKWCIFGFGLNELNAKQVYHAYLIRTLPEKAAKTGPIIAAYIPDNITIL